jgi:1-acyl-sn-glycerol-3-phosphate acyltransferase
MPLQIQYEFVPKRRDQYVFAANHFSYLDIVVVSAVIDNFFAFVGKSDVKNIPLLGYLFAKLHVLVDRADPGSRSKSVQKSFKVLESGRSIMLFAEGGIKAKHPPELFRPFKDGAFMMAIKYQLPIVPVTQVTNHLRLPDDGKLRLSPGVVKVIVHQPITTIGLGPDDIPALREQVFNIIQERLYLESIS